MAERYAYHDKVLAELARHGLVPLPATGPERLRLVVRDLYKYEIRKLRDAYIAHQFPKREFAGRVLQLRQRYWILSVPTELWTKPNDGVRE